jgi:hypothetical protein
MNEDYANYVAYQSIANYAPMEKTMKTKLQFVLALTFFCAVTANLSQAETKVEGESPTSPSTEATKTGSAQAIESANQAAGAVHSHDDEVSHQAATITDDEGLAEEDMEMPEEDLADAPTDGMIE